MKVILLALLASFLSTVECNKCVACTAWFDFPICGFNNRCYTAFKSSCEMEMINCQLPKMYRFVQAPYYGHCFRPHISKCKTYNLVSYLENKDRSVEIMPQ